MSTLVQHISDLATRIATEIHNVKANYATLASPTFTGTPSGPTAAAGTATTQFATTAFVDGSYLKITTAASTYAPLASPALTGTPTAPTPAAGDSSTTLATTAFVGSATGALLTTAGKAYNAASTPSTFFTNTLGVATTAAAAQTALGLGTAATYNTGTYGSNVVPLLGYPNSWGGEQGMPSMNLHAAAGSYRYFRINTGASTRWQYGADGVAEAGSNAGSNFQFQAFADDGSTQTNVFTVTRSTGAMTFYQPATFNSGVTANNIITTGIGVIGNYESVVANSSNQFYKTGLRNDGATFYIMASAVQTTQAAAFTASYSALRPFYFNLSTGAVNIDATGAGTTFGGGTTAPTMTISNAAGTSRILYLATANVTRWGIFAGPGAESGSNAGSNFNINAYDDSGAVIDTPVSILRAAGGQMAITRPLSLAAGVSVNSGASLASFALNANAAVYKYISFNTAGSSRWVLGSDNTAESGSNVGSSFFLNAYDDTGAFIKQVFTIARASGAMTYNGVVNIATSGSTGSLAINDTSGNGANIRLTGNGSSTPSKYIRANGGTLQVINDAYTSIILTLNDTGALTVTGSVAGSFFTTNSIGALGQYEMLTSVSSSSFFKSGMRADGTNLYLMTSGSQSTAAAASTAIYNTLRPFFFSLTSGAVTIDGTGAGTTFGGAISAVSVTGTSYVTTSAVNITGAAATSRNLAFYSAGSGRWQINVNSTSESGSNAGSDFGINALTDAGAYIDTPIFIARAAGGSISFSRPATFASNINATGAITATGNVKSGGNVIAAYTMTVDGVAGQNRQYTYSTSGVERWQTYTTGSAESGSNVGSDFAWAAYTDAGAYIDSPAVITRAAGGAFSINRPLFLGSYIQCAGGAQFNSFRNFAQVEMVYGSGSTWYNVGFRNDGGTFYLLPSSAASSQTAAQSASFGPLRPFSFALGTGAVTIDATGVGTSFGGAMSTPGRLTVNGGIYSANGDIISYRSGGTTGVIYLSSNLNAWLYNNGTEYSLNALGLSIGGNTHPSSDNAYTCGTSGSRWSVVYAGTGAISTSDERQKTVRGAMTADELAAAKDIAAAITIYQFNDQIAVKGADGARWHIGVVAQQVVSILQSHNLEPMRYAFVCYDEWDATEAVMGPTPPVDPDETTVVAPQVVITPAKDAGNQYGIRYEELSMFIAAAQEQRLLALEALMANK